MSTNTVDPEDLPYYYTRPTLVLGCGNRLFGDDGFGPAVAEKLLEDCALGDDISVVDVGIGARELLFNIMLGGTLVKNIIIVDAVDFASSGRKPGEVFEISIDDLPVIKRDDFSMHQVPSSNLLRELWDHAGMNVRILVCQVGHIPEEVDPGLTDDVKLAVPRMCDIIASNGFVDNPSNSELNN
jgi:coenzyme F420 hydrogenase subunit delta